MAIRLNRIKECVCHDCTQAQHLDQTMHITKVLPLASMQVALARWTLTKSCKLSQVGVLHLHYIIELHVSSDMSTLVSSPELAPKSSIACS